MMRAFTRFLAAAVAGWWWGGGMLAAQEGEEIILKHPLKDFIFFADRSQSVYVTVPATDEATAPDKEVTLNSFGVYFKAYPESLQEIPGFKLEFKGTKYVVPSKKIIVVPPHPKEQGIFAQSGVDPNGTGDCEVLLTVNWPDWPDKAKRIRLRTDLLPKELKVVQNGAGWSRPDGGISWTGNFVFHNGTGRPFILDVGYFDNLPTTENWPEIVIPAAD